MVLLFSYWLIILNSVFQSIDPSIFLQIAQLCSFLWLSNNPLCVCIYIHTHISHLIYPLPCYEHLGYFFAWLLLIMLQWTLECHYLFEFWFSLGINTRDWEYSLVAQMVKNPLAMQETRVLSLVREDLLDKWMATHFSILAWRIP